MSDQPQNLGIKIVSELRVILFSNLNINDSRLHNATIELFSAIESDLNIAGYEPSDIAEKAYHKFLKCFAKEDEEEIEITHTATPVNPFDDEDESA